VAKLVHSMIRVLEESRSIEFYKAAFGLDVADRLEFDGFTLVYLRNGENDVELELTVNKGAAQPYDLGNGYGHIAFVVEDVDAEHARFEAAGFSPRKLVDFQNDG
jgi:lactoylglutathione lyase